MTPLQRETHLGKQAGLSTVTAPEHCYHLASIWQLHQGGEAPGDGLDEAGHNALVCASIQLPVLAERGVQETHIICILHVRLYGACHIPSCHCLGPPRVLVSLILTVHAARQLETPQLLLEPLPSVPWCLHQRDHSCEQNVLKQK